MKHRLEKYIVSLLVIFSPFLPANGSLGIFPLLTLEKLLEAENEPRIAIPEPRDPVIRDLIDKLALCESSNNEDVEIVDTNGYYSRGVMQWQMRTFEYALADLGYEVGDHATLRAQMLDGDFAKQIASKWIDKDFKNVYHWSCYKKVASS